MDFSTRRDPVCLLLDNGSLRPAATLELRRLAGELAGRLGQPVEPVSLLHSARVPPAELNGRAAEILVDALRRRFANGAAHFLVVPLFFGPSGALSSYLPQLARDLAAELGPLNLAVADPVAGRAGDPPDPRLARILADHVRETMRVRRLARSSVVLVDHGSPQRVVGAVRDRIAEQLTRELGDSVAVVQPASMERRAGPEFDFNEPLLDRALANAAGGAGARDVVVAPLFFLPGRHAGPGGDIATMARNAEAAHAGLQVHFTRLVGEHPLLIDVLADRYREARRRSGR